MSLWKAIVNGDVYAGSRIIPGGVVLLEGDRIVAVDLPERVPIPEDADLTDAGGQIVAPGLVDIHVHGGDGGDFTDGEVSAVQLGASRHLRDGVTSMLATTATAPLDHVWQAFDAIIDVMQARQRGQARILGIHMEGNFFPESQRGAHAAELLGMPNAEQVERIYGYVPWLKRVTLAPELDGADQLISGLARRDVVVSAGHSDALYDQVCCAMALGVSHVTHLWSAMSMVRRIGPKRHAGLLEAALVEDGLTGEIIADGYHLPTSLMRMAYRMKGVERLCIISDGMRASGLGPGRYDVGGIQADVEAGYDVAVTLDRKAFAGSISTLGRCLRHMVHVVGISLVDALRMATETPARIMGLDQVGRLSQGCLADLVILDRATLKPLQVIVGGDVELRSV